MLINRDFVYTMNIQIAILKNHHSGKDTHIRQIKIFGPKEHGIPVLTDLPTFLLKNNSYMNIR
jgi:hypothetical protein